MSDSLISSLSRLTVSDDTVSSLIRSTPISYSAWTREPPAALLDPAGIVSGGVDPGRYLIPNLPVDQVAVLKDPLPLPLKIQPYTETTAAVAKPNLLLIVASLLALNHVTDIEAAWRTLGQYDVIVPRKVLTSILSGADDVQAYVWRPKEGGPLFIDRKSSYDTNPGSIGMQFERAVVRARADHFRYYGVAEVVLDDRLRVIVSGEVDAVKAASDARVEIKTRPSWARRDLDREFTTWLQAKIGAVETIVTAGFTAGYGSRTGPVSFAQANVAACDTADYFRVRGDHRTRLERGVQFLDDVIRGVTTCGKVYELSCSRDCTARSPVLRPAADMAHCTVTRELIEHLATRDLA